MRFLDPHGASSYAQLESPTSLSQVVSIVPCVISLLDARKSLTQARFPDPAGGRRFPDPAGGGVLEVTVTF